MDNIVKVNENTKVYVDGRIIEEVKKVVEELYKKEIEPTTQTSLESQVFQSINDTLSYYEFNDDITQTDDVGMLYVIDEPTTEDLSNITKSISTMTRKQQLNTAIITNSDNLIAREIQKICNNRLIPVFPSLENYIKYKG